MRRQGWCTRCFSVSPQSHCPAPSRAYSVSVLKGGPNGRSSLGNWAAELLLGHEVTLRTERKNVLVTVGSAGITNVCEAWVSPPPLTLRQPGLQSLAGSEASGPVRRGERKEDGKAHSALGMGCGGRIRNHGAQMPPFLD